MPIEILDTMQEEYERRSKNDPKLGQIRKQIKDGATYREAEAYGTRSGEILSDVMQINITEDVFNGDIPLEDLIVPMMRMNYEKVVSATSAVQTSLNKSANIGMKAIVPEFNEDEAVNLAEKMMSYDSFEDAEWLLGEPIVTNSLGVVTDMLHANADFQYRSGMSPKIVRTAEPDCCKWCAELAGVYEYRDLSSYDEVWKRHANCRCEVTYVPGDGRAQDSWSKKELSKEEKRYLAERIKRSQNLRIRTDVYSGTKMEPYSARGIEIPEKISNILAKTERPGQYCISEEPISNDDIRIMTRETGVEFAKLTIGNAIYILRGEELETSIPEELIEMMQEQGGSLDLHCHPFVGDVQPSVADRKALEVLEWINGQTESEIISVDGKQIRYNKNGIADIVIPDSHLTEKDKQELIKLFGGD